MSGSPDWRITYALWRLSQAEVALEEALEELTAVKGLDHEKRSMKRLIDGIRYRRQRLSSRYQSCIGQWALEGKP